jgi:hypothetical protein
VSLSVVIPTIGRPTLGNTLGSVAPHLLAGDHVIVAADMADGHARRHVRDLVRVLAIEDERQGRGATWTFAYPPEPLGHWGHAARNVALDLHIDTTHVCTIDDDDVYLPGWRAAIEARGCRDRPVVFKARWGAGHPAAGVELWHRQEVREGNVATPMVVWPAYAVARFGLRYEGDFDFYSGLERQYGHLDWDEEPIVEVRPVRVEEAA